MKRVLLHICCGSCAISVVEKLRADGFEPVGYFYNPNIQPKSEYLKRKKALGKISEILHFKIIEEKYNPKEHLEKTKDLEKPKRCFACYKLRLEKTAQKAKKLKIKYFTSTLLISPYQNLAKIRKISQNLASKYNLKFTDYDFIKDFRKGHQKTKDLGLYCQKYCGCLKSLKEK